MKKTLKTLLIFASCTLPLSSEGEEVSQSQRRDLKRPKGHHSPEMHMKRLIDNLELDESQQEIAKGLLQENRQKKQDYQTQMESLMKEMEELRKSESSDENRMIEIGGEMGKLKVSMGLLVKSFFNNLKIHLTEEQLEKHNEIKERMKKMADHVRRKGPPRMHRRFKGGPDGPEGQGGFFKKRRGPEDGAKPESSESKAEEPAVEL